MSRIIHRYLFCALILNLMISVLCAAAMAQDMGQNIAPPIPQKLVLHSNVLNEDRIIWIRTPPNYEQGHVRFPVLYLMDGPAHINEIGGTIDFLVNNGRMPQLIVVGIANTDRTRDLTPTHWDQKSYTGMANTSGGGEHFLDFVQTELMPEIEKRYRTASYKILAGHSLGGLMAIHTLITRPNLFNAYIAVSPSLQWDDLRTVHQAQEFFAAHTELNRTLFFSLANEGDTPNPMGAGFEQFQKLLAEHAPKDFRWDSARYQDEDHGSTVLRAHYAGLRTIFSDWQMSRDPNNGLPTGGLQGLEKHYEELSQRYGYKVPIPENAMNNLGYTLMEGKKYDEAIAVFLKNVEFYPESANVYDSLGEGYENAGKFDLAAANFQKAVEIGTRTGDQNLSAYNDHIKRVAAETKASSEKAAGHN